MAVTVDAYSSGNGGINNRFLSSSLASGGVLGPNFFTVASDATLLLVWSVIQDQPANYGTMTVTWDSGGTNQVMTLVGQVINFDTFNCFALVNPTPGTKSLLIRATTETSQNLQTIGQSLKGTVTSSAAAAVEGFASAFDWGSGSNPVSVSSAVSIPVGDLAFSFYLGQNNFPTIPTDSGILVDAEFGVLAEEQYSGAGSVITASNTMSSSGFWQASIIGVKAAGTSITGTMAVTESPDTFAGAGTLVTTGTMAVTETPDMFAGTGTVAWPAITGTMAVTEAPDIFAGSAFGTITGTMAVVEHTDIFAASGSTFSAITGTMAVTETPDRFTSPAAAALQTLSLYGRPSGMMLQGSSS